MSRKEVTLKFRVGQRNVEIKAYDNIGIDDCYENLAKSVMHRYVTGEDLTMPIPREVKDWMIRTNLFV